MHMFSKCLWISISYYSKLVYSFASLSLKPKQGSRVVQFTVLAPNCQLISSMMPSTIYTSDKKIIIYTPNHMCTPTWSYGSNTLSKPYSWKQKIKTSNKLWTVRSCIQQSTKKLKNQKHCHNKKIYLINGCHIIDDMTWCDNQGLCHVHLHIHIQYLL